MCEYRRVFNVVWKEKVLRQWYGGETEVSINREKYFLMCKAKAREKEGLK